MDKKIEAYGAIKVPPSAGESVVIYEARVIGNKIKIYFKDPKENNGDIRCYIEERGERIEEQMRKIRETKRDGRELVDWLNKGGKL
ncbi:hypothetical protein CMI44_01825 [Candidatus Pacearchaeota archaeon]|jgi:hypothetical protein|nr:hypothetical protein [Candidatus Pacearchaeota archaeon]|tara:strand:- start:1568 stop:1825 length:258 start_codon:yes stop_codon:yes gene_type:complete